MNDMNHAVSDPEPSGVRSGARGERSVLPYSGIHGLFVGDGHFDYRKRIICPVCREPGGMCHADGCPESHRDLNAERPFKEFSLAENLIIEEVSGVPWRGNFWGGFGGDPVTNEEVQSSAPSFASGRYMPPAAHTLQEAIELVKRHFSVDAKQSSPPDVRDWARKHGYKVSDRGRLPSDVVAAYQKT